MESGSSMVSGFAEQVHISLGALKLTQTCSVGLPQTLMSVSISQAPEQDGGVAGF